MEEVFAPPYPANSTTFTVEDLLLFPVIVVHAADFTIILGKRFFTLNAVLGFCLNSVTP